MLDMLLYADISCTDAASMMDRIRKHQDLPEIAKTELVEVIQEATPDCDWECNTWDAND